MFKLESLQLSSFHLWDDLEFTFEEGITFINGRNRSGKSLLMSPIPAILYDVDPIPTNSRAVLSLTSDQHELDFTVFNQSGKRNKFEIAIDGRDQKTETINAGRTLIDEHFCAHIQYSLFETTVSISGLAEHPLAKKGSKPSQRLDWVHETLAYASVLDSYLEDVEKKLKHTRDDAVRFNLLKDQLNKLETVEKPTSDPDKIKGRLTVLNGEIKELERKKRLVEQALELDTKRVQKPDLSLEEAQQKLKAQEAIVRQQNALKPLFESYEEDLAKYKKHQKNIDAAKGVYKTACESAKLKAQNPSTVEDSLGDDIRALQQRIKRAISNNAQYEQEAEDRDLAQSDHEVSCNSEKEFTKRINDLRETIAINSSQLKFIKGDKRNCPMCGSNKSHMHDAQSIERERDKAKKRLESIEYDYSVWQARQKTYVEYIDVEKLEKRVEKLTNVIAAAEAYNNLVNRRIDEPEQVDFDVDKLKKAKNRVEFYSNAVIEAKAYTASKKIAVPDNNEYVSWKKTDLRALEVDLDKELRQKSKQHSELSEKLITVKTNAALYTKYIGSRRELIEAAKPLKQANSDNRLLQIAKKGLGRDGFRTKRLEKTLELFVHNLNEFAPLIWDEPFKFEIETGPRKCDVVVHRNNKYGTTSTFSGSEKRCWQALAALAMLRLLPSNRRCDTIILDELDANMDMTGRAKLIQDFIPELRKTVDKIIVVSPLTKKELGITPDRAFLVEKRRAKSRLITL